MSDNFTNQPIPSDSQQGITSPCVNTCCLDPNDVCIGCGRSLDEILQWSSANNDEKNIILDTAKQRLNDR